MFLVAFATFGAATGCAIERTDGEFGIGACSDGRDNDEDDVADCMDPDCQAEAACGRAAPLRDDRHVDEAQPPAAQPPARPPISMTGDAGSPVVELDDPSSEDELPPAVSLPDPDAPPDGGTLEPEPECPVCADTESCIKGYCIPKEAVFAELWDVTEVSVIMSRMLDPPALGCIDDPPCHASADPRFSLCVCAPDPMVQVVVTRPGEEPEIMNTTKYQTDADEATWSTAFQLALRPEYEITLRAMDANTVSERLTPRVIYECTLPADPTALASGVLTCAGSYEGTGITVSIRPASVPGKSP